MKPRWPNLSCFQKTKPPSPYVMGVAIKFGFRLISENDRRPCTGMQKQRIATSSGRRPLLLPGVTFSKLFSANRV